MGVTEEARGGFLPTRHCWRDGGLKGARPTPANMVRTAETLYWGGAAESRCRRLRMGVIAQWIGGRRMVGRGAAIVALGAGVAAARSGGPLPDMVPGPAHFPVPGRLTLFPPPFTRSA